MRVAFLGSPPFEAPIFEALLASDHHTVAGLVTPPDRPRGRGRAVVRSELAAAADADANIKRGGFENEVVANGNGTSRVKKTRMQMRLIRIIYHSRYTQSIAVKAPPYIFVKSRAR